MTEIYGTQLAQMPCRYLCKSIEIQNRQTANDFEQNSHQNFVSASLMQQLKLTFNSVTL